MTSTPSAPDWRSGGLGPSCLRGPGARIPSRTTRNGTRHPAPRHAASAGSSTSVGDRPASPIRPSRLGVSVLDSHPVPTQLKAPHAQAFNAGTEGEDRRGRSRLLCTLERPHRAQPPMAVGPAGSGPRAGRGSRAGARRGNDREPLGCCVQACASGFRISRRGLSPKDRTARENLAARIRAQARGTDPVRRRIGVRAAGSDIESAEPPEERDALIRWPAAQSADPQLTSYRPRRLSSFPPPRPCILYVMARAVCLGVPLGHWPLCVAGTAERNLAPLPRLASPAFLRPVSLRENTDYSALP